jgi:hypothetical protein
MPDEYPLSLLDPAQHYREITNYLRELTGQCRIIGRCELVRLASIFGHRAEQFNKASWH